LLELTLWAARSAKRSHLPRNSDIPLLYHQSMARGGRWLIAIGIFVLLAIAGGAIAVWYRDHAAARQQTQKPASPAPLPPGAEVTLSGTISARHVVEVPASIDGTLEQFHADVGQEVFEGQLLANIKNTALESARDQAQLELETVRNRITNLESSIISARLEASRAAADATRARSEFDRIQRLYERQRILLKEGATPRLVFEKVEKEYLAIKSEYESARELSQHADERVSILTRQLENLKKVLQDKEDDLEGAVLALAATEVHSPVDGVVVARRGEPGVEVTRDWKDLFQIATDLGDLRVTLEPEPPILSRIQVAQPVLVFPAEAGTEPLNGVVAEISDSKVVIDFRSPSPDIRPGMTAKVRLKLQ
jgi:multidrug resistance efflux pump